MKVNVKLIGAFRVGRFKEKVCDCRSEASVREIVDSLQLPEQILGFALINGVHAEFEDLLQEGDSLTILPILDGG